VLLHRCIVEEFQRQARLASTGHTFEGEADRLLLRCTEALPYIFQQGIAPDEWVGGTWRGVRAVDGASGRRGIDNGDAPIPTNIDLSPTYCLLLLIECGLLLVVHRVLRVVAYGIPLIYTR
jgi:hypothetical protein